MLAIAPLVFLAMLFSGMAIDDRRERDRTARRRLIVTTARTLAEAEGWDAVTTRRLSAAIEYSQPVLYKHFAGMEQIADAVAVEGFGELAHAVRAAQADSESAAEALGRSAHAYLDFARGNPAVYDAMFTRATGLRFAAEDTPPQLEDSFAAVREAVGAVAGDRDADTLTEVLWAALHGLVTLSRAGRLRADYASDRIRLLVNEFAGER
jgi:AcrR family transcriptional regulator